MPLNGNMSHDIKAEVHSGKPQRQAVAIAYSEAKKKKKSGTYSKSEVQKAAQMASDDPQNLFKTMVEKNIFRKLINGK